MPRVEVEVVDDEVDNDRGGTGPGVRATCSRCDLEVTCLGRSQRSVKRCMVLLKEECEEDESNFYVDPDMEDRPE